MDDRNEDRNGQPAIIGLSSTTQVGAFILMGTVMAVYVGEDGSPFAVSLVMSGYFLAAIVLSPVWGAIADVTGKRRFVLVVTTVASAVSIVPLVVYDGVWESIAVRVVYGAFACSYLPLMLTIASNRGGADGRGRAIGFLNSSRSVGFTVGQGVAGALIGIFSSSVVYLLVAVIGFVAALSTLFVTDPTPNPASRPSLREVATKVRERLLPSVDDRTHLTTNGLHWLYVVLVLRNMAWLGISSLLPVYIVTEVGTSAFVMGLLIAGPSAVEIGGMYVFGRVADSTGRKPLITIGTAGHGVMGVLIASAVFVGSVPLGAILVGAGLVAKAVVYSAFLTGSVAFIGDVSAVDRESELMGLRSTAKGIGGVFGPLLVGGLATVISYEVSFLAVSSLMFVGAALAHRFIVESRPGTTNGVAKSAATDG